MTPTAERNLGARLRSAARVEPSRMPRLKLLGAAWADGFATALRAEFGSTATAAYVGAETVKSGRSGSTPAFVMAARVPGWPEPAVLVADAMLVPIAVDCLLGGDGGGEPQERAPGELDLRFARLVLERFLRAAEEALGPVMAPVFAAGPLVAADTASALAEILGEAPSPYLDLVFTLSLGRLASEIRLALPEQVLALHRRKLDRLPEPPPPAVDAGWAREIEEGLLDAEMQLTALLDERRTTLGEIAGLAVGQTLVLSTRVDSLITVECAEQRLFRGRMGRARDSYLVRIEEKIDPTEEFIDDILAD